MTIFTSTHTNNNIYLTMNKVVYGQRYWIGKNIGDCRYYTEQPSSEMVFGIERHVAIREKKLEQWDKMYSKYGFDKITFVVQFCMTNGHVLEFSGERASSLWDAYKAHVFAKTKHENKRTNNQGDNLSDREQHQVSKPEC